MKRVLWVLGTLLGVYFIARAVSWPFTINPSDPATYASDWGGPSLLGVALVHCGPGIVSAAIFAGLLVASRRRARKSSVDGATGT